MSASRKIPCKIPCKITCTFTAALAACAMVSPLAAQSSVTLDGTNGSNQINTPFSTNGGLTLDLGFYVEYLIVGGGGGGGNAYEYGPGGGGGAGGLLQGTQIFKNATSIDVAVGAGGAGGIAINDRVSGTNGENSSFGGIVALGGGGGGGSRVSGLAGGSGGAGGALDRR